jgi:hypothetical protein
VLLCMQCGYLRGRGMFAKNAGSPRADERQDARAKDKRMRAEQIRTGEVKDTHERTRCCAVEKRRRGGCAERGQYQVQRAHITTVLSTGMRAVQWLLR